ncbi:TonB-dependent receptor [Cecembia rubra]|uniref:TonB-dependent receptor-like protein n=1 Tax=Cecembia rubra TaxID=1485585 RepID=A0A2P8DW96_9BACT|nr:TonB-dependent receptor [Cecembia rubra]PSL01464.1 TonB-dependent receptor-like protein [Cecembia rubra]
MKKLFLLFVLVNCFFSKGNAQNEFKEIYFEHQGGLKKEKYLLTGTVTSKETGMPLENVSVHIDGFFTGINTDNFGQYVFSLDSGRHRIVFRRFGKNADFFIVNIFRDAVLDVTLGNFDFQLEMFTVMSEERDRNVRSPITGVTKMNIEELKLVPALLGEPDVFNVLQSMPGVTSVGEGSGGLNIRGGQADQNLIMMNEAIVLSNNHALGFLSAFNGDVLQNFSLYKGNVPSQFGGRSASALNIQTRNGDFENWGGTVSVGSAVTRLMLEGPIKTEKTSMIAALRRSNLNWKLSTVDQLDVQDSRLNFHDIYGGISHKFSQKNTIEFNLLNTGDRFQYSDQFGFQWNNFVSSLTSKNLVSDNFSIIGLVALGNFSNQFFEPTINDGFRITNGLEYQQAKLSGLWTSESVELTFGAEAVNYQMKPEQREPFNETSGILPGKVNKERGFEWAPFIGLDWTVSENFSLSVGARYSFYQQNGPDSVFLYQENLPVSRLNIMDRLAFESGPIVSYSGFEPRISFRWSLDETQSIKAGASLMNQYLQTISNATGPTPIDLWQISTTYILPQRSYNYSLGYFKNINENEWSTSLEGYYRISENQLEYRDFADLFLNPHIETELVQGEGRAYGIELLIQRNRGIVTGWLSYTYSRSLVRTTSPFREIQVNRGEWFPTNFDRPHILSLVSSINLGKKRFFNASFNYSTGRPVTAPSTNYIIAGIFIPDFGDRNQFRIPDYIRLDFSYLTNGIVRNWDDAINFSIYNVMSRRNAYSVFFQRENQSRRLRPYQLSVLGSIFPSVTYSVNF